MPTYIYKARDETGKAVRGAMDAASKEELAEKLRKMGYMPTSLREPLTGFKLEGIGQRFKKIRVEDIIIFNLQLANMLDSGLTILDSLNTISTQLENKKLKEIIGEVARAVEGGSLFSDALSKHPEIFSTLFIGMVRAGEASGNLNKVLKRFSIYIEQQEDLRQKIKSALLYPAILLIAGIAVIILIVSFVMPKFVDIFTKANVALPLPTIILYAVGLGLKRFWYLAVLVICLGVVIIKMYVRTERGRLKFDQLKLKAPVIGPLARKVVISRFSRTLATLLDSGVPVLQSLDIVRHVVGNEVIARVVQNVRDSIEEGERLAQPLRISQEFPPDTVQMIFVGEETGKLGNMLDKIADFYDTAVGYSIKKLTVLIEPVFLVIMGSMVGFIMASMLLPIFDMIKTIQR